MSKITDEMETMVAGILDYPSVYMGGPSQHNRRRARDIVAAVYPLIEAQVREDVAETLRLCIDDLETVEEERGFELGSAKKARALLAAMQGTQSNA